MGLSQMCAMCASKCEWSCAFFVCTSILDKQWWSILRQQRLQTRQWWQRGGLGPWHRAHTGTDCGSWLGTSIVAVPMCALGVAAVASVAPTASGLLSARSVRTKWATASAHARRAKGTSAAESGRGCAAARRRARRGARTRHCAYSAHTSSAAVSSAGHAFAAARSVGLRRGTGRTSRSARNIMSWCVGNRRGRKGKGQVKVAKRGDRQSISRGQE